jgi:hypothetical protein
MADGEGSPPHNFHIETKENIMDNSYDVIIPTQFEYEIVGGGVDVIATDHKDRRRKWMIFSSDVERFKATLDEALADLEDERQSRKYLG